MDRRDHRRAQAGTAHGVGGRDGVVSVNELKRERACEPSQGERQRGRRPRAPGCVRALTRGRHVRNVDDGEPVVRLAARLAHELRERARCAAQPSAERGPRRHQAMQDQDADLGAGAARGERLAVRPHAQHGVAMARVELGDDRDLRPCPSGVAHQLRWVVRVRAASRAFRYGRSARNERASAIAAARS